MATRTDRPDVTRRRLLRASAASLVLASAGLRAADAATPCKPSFAEVVRRRAMIRAYKSEPVPDEKVDRLLRYATRSPSGGNLQPWEFIVVRNADVRAQLAKAAAGQTSVATAGVIIVTCANVERTKQFGNRGTFFSLVDTAFASLLILLGAVEQDLGACFVGTYDPFELAKILGLPDHVRPVGLITIGIPAETPKKPPNPQRPLHTLVHRDRW
jgi:nitroreductase